MVFVQFMSSPQYNVADLEMKYKKSAIIENIFFQIAISKICTDCVDFGVLSGCSDE